MFNHQYDIYIWMLTTAILVIAFGVTLWRLLKANYALNEAITTRMVAEVQLKYALEGHTSTLNSTTDIINGIVRKAEESAEAKRLEAEETFNRR